MKFCAHALGAKLPSGRAVITALLEAACRRYVCPEQSIGCDMDEEPEHQSQKALGTSHQLAFAIERVCEITSLGRTSVFAAIKNGELIARKHGRRTIVLADDLRTFLENLPSTRTMEAHPGDER